MVKKKLRKKRGKVPPAWAEEQWRIRSHEDTDTYRIRVVAAQVKRRQRLGRRSTFKSWGGRNWSAFCGRSLERLRPQIREEGVRLEDDEATKKRSAGCRRCLSLSRPRIARFRYLSRSCLSSTSHFADSSVVVQCVLSGVVSCRLLLTPLKDSADAACV
ncbi:hypothetical protein MRX96_051347 [Rhipicephalus microplus]